MNTPLVVLVVTLASAVLILGIIYLDKMTKTPAETLLTKTPETPQSETLEPAVFQPVEENLPIEKQLPAEEEVPVEEVLEPVKETVNTISTKKPKSNRRKAK